jgi:hypothetical protein
LSHDQLGFPVDVVRKAAGMLPSSPVYALVQGHMAGICRRADALASDASAATIGDATLQLVRAMISSAGQDDLHSDSVMNETLYTRIVAFIQQNLTDPDLSPGADCPGASHLGAAALQVLGAQRAEPFRVDHERAPGRRTAQPRRASDAHDHRHGRAPRQLRAGAQVTRIAPSPTGFMHFWLWQRLGQHVAQHRIAASARAIPRSTSS